MHAMTTFKVLAGPGTRAHDTGALRGDFGQPTLCSSHAADFILMSAAMQVAIHALWSGIRILGGQTADPKITRGKEKKKSQLHLGGQVSAWFQRRM